MERTVPSTASEEIDLYQRTYYSLLRSTAEVQIRTLEEAHARMKSLLHTEARDLAPDMSAFVYCLLRLPTCMPEAQLVVLGQSPAVFNRGGFGNVDEWKMVSSPARRRRCLFDGRDTLACYIASRSDIDDMIPLLTAYQIEWNKIHFLLDQVSASISLDKPLDQNTFLALAAALKISPEDLAHLQTIWGNQFLENLNRIRKKRCNLRVRLLSGSLSEYWRATRIWWENIERSFPMIVERPVYFVSSNPHSMVNLVSGFALTLTDELVSYLNEPENGSLLEEWERIESDPRSLGRENFLYYVMKKYQRAQEGAGFDYTLVTHEQSCGIDRIPSEHSFDVEAQVIELASLRLDSMDPRINGDLSYLADSNALILNIDYPLGLAAYNILSKVAEHAGEVLGVYVTGKAATLNGVIGDVMVPNVVHDEQSRNTYMFPNTFSAADISPFLMYGTVLDNQKAVTVRGTFLQNEQYMDVFYREGYTDIEMEAGPYLSAVFEMFRPQRHPVDEIINLYGLPFDLGILHYASDTPLTKGKNLGAGSLSYFGMDSTYAVSLAILRRIFQLEQKRLST